MKRRTNDVAFPMGDRAGQAVQPFSERESEALRNYFMQQSQRLMDSFDCREADDAEAYLLSQSEKMMELLAMLQVPWYKYVPILYESFVLYLDRIEGRKAHNRALKMTGEFMKSVAELSQMTGYVTKMIFYYRQQVCDLKTLRPEDEAAV